MVLDPTPRIPLRLRASADLKVVDGIENRTIFLGMDQFREELPGSNIKGKNPLKDVQVRKALYQAIDANTISTSCADWASSMEPSCTLRRAGPRPWASASFTT